MGFPHDVMGRFRRLRPSRSRPGTWTALCPAHGDRGPSLSLWVGRDGRLMVGCWAGCDKRYVLTCAGLSMGDLFPPGDGEGPYGERNGAVRRAERHAEVVARYEYHDEGGELLYRVCRTADKHFFQQRPDGNGGWVNGLGDCRRVLFRLPEIAAAPSRLPVLVVEGEKDVLAAEGLGLLATCNVGGTGMGWRDEYSVSLAGRRVAVVPDNDDAGRKHAERVVGSLVRHGAAGVRLAELPGLPTGGDLSDWLAALPRALVARRELCALIRQAPEWRSK